MTTYITAEYIKGKRSFSHFFIFLFPFFIVLICVPFSQFMYADINFFVPLIYNWWPTLFLPMGLSILGYQSIQREIETGTDNYSHLLNQNLFWQSKMIVLVGYSLFSNLLIALLTILLEYLMYSFSTIIILNVITASLILWITTLFIIPLSILLSQLCTPIFSILINILGIVASIFTVSGKYWYTIPWGWSLRLMMPLIGINPNGTLLSKEATLNASAIIVPGTILAIVTFIILYTCVPLFLTKIRRRD